jgi:chaperonin GroES
MSFKYKDSLVYKTKEFLVFIKKTLDILTFSYYNTFAKKIARRKKMNFQPLANRVLVEREEEVTTTASGIIIPDNAKEKPLQGKALAVGPDAEEEGIKVGDTVVFGKYSGSEITLDGKEYLILTSDDILGLLK